MKGMMTSELLLVICNVPDPEVAETITTQLLQRKLVACVNQLPPVVSTYSWQGQIEQSTEIPLHIKTSAENFASVSEAICALHPYQVPEIIAIPITNALDANAKWVKKECVVEH